MVTRWMVPILAATFLAACDGGGTETEEAKKKLEESCNIICEKGYDPPCQGLTVDQCKAACPQLETALEQQFGGACIGEYANLYSCAADLEYQCTENGPQPVSGSGCYSEALDLQSCMESAPCKNYCGKKSDCDKSDVTACEASCAAELEGGSTCSYEYENLIECQGQGGLVCTDGKLTTVGCNEDLSSYAYCVASSKGVCGAFCIVKSGVGCGTESEDACTSACTSELDAATGKNCNYQFEDLKNCQMGHGVPCNDNGEPSIAGCSEEAWEYQNCLGGN